MLGYPPYQENTGFNSGLKNMPSEEDRLAITELFNTKQALMVELQHYEANAANGSTNVESLERPASAMPTNTRLQVAVLHTPDEVRSNLKSSFFKNVLPLGIIDILDVYLKPEQQPVSHINI